MRYGNSRYATRFGHILIYCTFLINIIAYKERYYVRKFIKQGNLLQVIIVY